MIGGGKQNGLHWLKLIMYEVIQKSVRGLWALQLLTGSPCVKLTILQDTEVLLDFNCHCCCICCALKRLPQFHENNSTDWASSKQRDIGLKHKRYVVKMNSNNHHGRTSKHWSGIHSANTTPSWVFSTKDVAKIMTELASLQLPC